MIGKSYDGTLANGVAATGVDGLKTIVPDQRHLRLVQLLAHRRRAPQHELSGGPERQRHHRPAATPNPPGVNLPSRQAICTPVNNDISNDANVDTGDGDTHGDVNTFWRDRDYVKDAAKVKAAVFATHGIQDDNVRMDHMGMWWDALKANNVPRKLWLLRTGHDGSVRVAPRRVGRPRCTAGSTTGCTASRTGS